MNWTEGDIFLWYWKTPGRSTWCCSGIGVIKNDVLVDTYWSDGSLRLGQDKAKQEMDLEWVANLADLQKIRDGDAKYFARTDVVCLNHSNDPVGNTYIRKGVGRCRTRMLEEIALALEKAESTKRQAEFSIRRLTETKASIETSGVTGVYF